MSARGSSKQNYGTPRPFLDAVERRFGTIEWDLAADADNSVVRTKVPCFYSEAENALSKRWSDLDGLLFLNPPFANIAPWAAKCAEESARGAKIALLTPASVGAVWYREHVHGKAYVFGLSPRLSFVGTTDPYPKDLALSLFTPEGYSGFEPWNWLDWWRPT